MPEPILYRELDIIGYADVPGTRIHPRILPPVFRVRGTQRVLFPPYSLLRDSVAGAVESSMEEFSDRAANGRQITALPDVRPAQEAHHLWIDDQNNVHYSARLDVQKAFDDLFFRHLVEAEKALAQNPPALDDAYSHAAVAHAIRPEHIDPLVIRGVVEWERHDVDSQDYTEELAREQTALANFRQLVAARRGKLPGKGSFMAGMALRRPKVINVPQLQPVLRLA